MSRIPSIVRIATLAGILFFFSACLFESPIISKPIVANPKGYRYHYGPFDHNGTYQPSLAGSNWQDHKTSSSHRSKKKPTYTSSGRKPTTNTKKVTPKPTYVIHVVKKGDTLYGLAKKYKSGVSTIRIANGIKSSSNLIKIGQKIKIPRF